MKSLTISFLISFILSWAIIHTKNHHKKITSDTVGSEPQKFHRGQIPRVGGAAIFLALILGICSHSSNNQNFIFEITMLLVCIPVFLIGLIEDFTKKIGVTIRLFFAAFSATLFVYFLDIQILKIGIPFLDLIIQIPFFGAIFTIFAITGLANAYNIIDGFNGIASMIGILSLLGLAYMGYLFTDPLIMYLCLVMVAALVGFFAWNYPFGLIFLGDGGAYLVGFWIASVSVILTYKHQEISPWFALLVNSYPIIETLFTIYRRKIHSKVSPGKADAIHLHTLIYRRILIKQYNCNDWHSANARTAPYLWFFTCLSIIPALIWWNNTIILLISFIAYSLFYSWIYYRIVKFKVPCWLN